MEILVADDSSFHMSVFETAISAVCSEKGLPLTILGKAANGEELTTLYTGLNGKKKIDFVFCDIRMPKQDGLTTLVKIKNLNPQQKFILVSSEDMGTVEKMYKLKGGHEEANSEKDRKLELIGRVVARIKSNTVEAGKVNSVLEACEKLLVDPIEMASKLGATAYLKKPYDKEKVRKLLDLVSGATPAFQAIL